MRSKLRSFSPLRRAPAASAAALAARADEERAGELRALLGRYDFDYSDANARRFNFSQAWGGAITSVRAAWKLTQSVERPPQIVVVFGAHFAYRYGNSTALSSEHPLVQDHLADPGERYNADELRAPLPELDVFCLFNPELAHSQIRWIESSGDRQIVVLPPPYEGR